MRLRALARTTLAVTLFASAPLASIPSALAQPSSGEDAVKEVARQRYNEGVKAFDAGKYEDAFHYFRRASYYADKPSQGMVAEMLWEGKGTPRDPALAYAWMDVAAERGYLGFLSLRERYWEALDAGDRERALREGEGIYAEYGDDVAEPRLNAALRRGSRSVVGSRTGFVGAVSIHIEGYGEIPASQYFAPKYWDPKQYREWHDQVWQKPLTGQVKVGDVETVGDGKPANPPPRRDPPTADDPR